MGSCLVHRLQLEQKTFADVETFGQVATVNFCFGARIYILYLRFFEKCRTRCFRRGGTEFHHLRPLTLGSHFEATLLLGLCKFASWSREETGTARFSLLGLSIGQVLDILQRSSQHYFAGILQSSLMKCTESPLTFSIRPSCKCTSPCAFPRYMLGVLD